MSPLHFNRNIRFMCGLCWKICACGLFPCSVGHLHSLLCNTFLFSPCCKAFIVFGLFCCCLAGCLAGRFYHVNKKKYLINTCQFKRSLSGLFSCFRNFVFISVVIQNCIHVACLQFLGARVRVRVHWGWGWGCLLSTVFRAAAGHIAGNVTALFQGTWN